MAETKSEWEKQKNQELIERLEQIVSMVISGKVSFLEGKELVWKAVWCEDTMIR